jgi:hypothetical protein
MEPPMRRIASFAPVLLPAVLAASILTVRSAHAQNVSTFANGLPDVRAVAFDATGRLYIARRTPAHAIVYCTPPSNTMSAFASVGLSDPVAMVCDAAGNVFVADYNDLNPGGAVHKITPGGTRTTFAALPNPASITIDASDNLYVGRWDRIINMITPAGTVTTYADFNSVSYLGVLSVNNHITALHMDSDGTLYVATSWGALFKVGPGGSPITPINRVMLECFGLAKSLDGYLYASTYNHQEIWRIALGGSATLCAGATSVSGLVNGPLLSARFHDPAGIASYNGLVYVADYSNSAVRTFADLTSPVATTSWGRIKTLYR